jgi:PEP-CTERM motif
MENKLMKKSLIFVKSVIGLSLVSASAVHAVPIVFSGSDVSGRAASVSFDTSGSDLLVTLINTSANDVLVPVDVLTAVFFNVGGNPALGRTSALSGGSTFFGTTAVSPSGTDVRSEWAYLNGLSQYGANAGISSVGLGIFGPGNRFDTVGNLSGPASPNGLQYGITSAGDNSSTGNAAVTGTELTKNSVSFILSNLPVGFTTSSITKVTFQYGTSLTEPSVPGGGGGGNEIPEPESLLLLGLGLVGLGVGRRQKR